jgi:hypothetical protein
MRNFIRHPADIPIEVTTVDQGGGRAPRLVNVGLGGLAFRSNSAFRPSHVVKVRIGHVRPAFETTARVAWCRASEGEYELGLAFIDPDDAYRARMVEQVCHIEHYRKEVRATEGRELTSEDAAREWSAKHAAAFPAAGPDGA